MVEYSPVDEFSGFGMVKSKMAAINFFYSCHLNEGNSKLQYSGVSGIQVSSNQVVTVQWGSENRPFENPEHLKTRRLYFRFSNGKKLPT